LERDILMAEKINPQACFFVTRNSLSLFSTVSSNGVELVLTAEIVKDLEVVSQQALERVLSTYIEQIKIPIGQVSLILDNSVYFHTTISKMPETNEDPIVQSFLDLVPFTDVLVKSFPIKEGAYLTVINSEFLNPIISVLEKFGFIVISATPVFVLGVDTSKTPFTKEIALQALANPDLLYSYNFLEPEQVEAKLDVPEAFL